MKIWFNHKIQEINKKNKTANKRSLITQNQLEMLQSYFENDQKPKRNKLKDLSNATGLSVIKIDNWFQQKRFKTKKKLQSNNNNQLLKSEKRHRKKIKKFTVVEKALLKSKYEEC